MTGKLFRSSLMVGLSTMLLCIGLFFGVLYQHFGTQLMSELTTESFFVAQGMNLIGQDYLEELSTSHRITWIDGDGTVLYDNWVSADTMESHLYREEVQEAMSSGTGVSNRWSTTLSQRTLYVSRLLEDNTVIRIATTQASVLALLSSLTQPLLLILLLCLLLSAVLSLRLAQVIIKPILAIDLEHPEYFTGYEELTPLLSRIKRQNTTIHRQIVQLQQAQTEFSAVTDNMSEGFCLLDREGHLLSYNSATLKLLESQPLEGDGIHSYLELNRNLPFRQAVESALGGTSNQQIAEFGPRICKIMANPVLQDGTNAGAVVVILDVTARQRGEEMRREFTANVSHELKTPLTSISGIAELMQNGLIRPDDVPDFASDIYQEAQRLISLVGDILRLSQLDEGAPEIEQTDVDLHELAQEILARLAKPAEKNQITLKLLGESALIHGSHRVLDEMLSNLIDNAIKYNRPRGTVRVTIQNQPDGHISLEVADTGLGIPDSDKKRVFERFYRVDKSHSKAIGGTGLGLSIVKHGAAYHNATVSLESQEGVGTAVTILF